MKLILISILVSQSFSLCAWALSKTIKSEKKTLIVFNDEDVPHFETEIIHGKTQLNLVRKRKKNTVQSSKPNPSEEIK